MIEKAVEGLVAGRVSQAGYDFVVDPSELGGIARFPLKVTGDAETGIATAASSLRRTFMRGIIATHTRFQISDDILVMLAAVLLAGLPDRTERRLSTL